ncbi:MAG: formimidoylglutamate deiminase [Rhodobacteraceae bacterium]|nr:formimidoylglutamate deiminase [Paracoccaceae bacterium]
MQTLWARQALLPDGWAGDVRIDIGSDGRIAAVEREAAPWEPRHAIVLPAPANLHSHAFQRAMAGLTEARGPDPSDSFWTWRRLMYRFLDRLSPDAVEDIAAVVQMEMLEAGYACSVEFHYLHHNPDGRPYGDVAEMSRRIMAAAATTGIGLTLLPVLYSFGGCDRRPLGPGQVRFGCGPDDFARLHRAAAEGLADMPADARIGVAPHSLRAVDRAGLDLALQTGNGPIHMHLAEQEGEVTEVEATLGARPVRWLMDNLPVDDRWCLIHCTQMLPDETRALAATGAVAGLCPITEASLGDGIFDGVRWAGAGGRFGIGSDSNIRIALTEELRMLEYSQRLRDHTRAAMARPDASTGRVLFAGAVEGGAQAAGRESGAIAPGRWADLITLDEAAPDLAGLAGDMLLDSWIFAAGEGRVRDVWAAGRHVVKEGRHIAREAITRRYLACCAGLRDAL